MSVGVDLVTLLLLGEGLSDVYAVFEDLIDGLQKREGK